MAKLLRARWTTDLGAGLPRRDRRSCDYDAYIPDVLMAREIVLEGPVTADVSQAEAALVRFDLKTRALQDSEALARLLLRTESVASSRIEGLEVGARRLLHADAERKLGHPVRDVTAAEVLAAIDAMRYAIDQVTDGRPLSADLLLATHQRLLAGTRLEAHGGRLRQQQNWIGGSAFNPCSAEYIPPPHELVPDLVADLCAFANDDSLPAVAQAAIAHAQFETIHPFVDGNGRVGRVLVHLILRRRGLAVRALPPVSLILATWSREYVDALSATRYLGSPVSVGARDGLNRWVGLFAAATLRAVADADAFDARVESLKAEWGERLGRVRAGSAVDLLLRALPGSPILTVRNAADLIGRSNQAVNAAVSRLLDAGVLAQTTLGRRNRAFEAPDVITAFTDLERRLASPAGDTRAAAPARRVPRKR